MPNKEPVLFEKYKALAEQKPAILATTKQALFIMACAMKALPPEVASQFQAGITAINFKSLREGYAPITFPNGGRLENPSSLSALKAIYDKVSKGQDIPEHLEKQYGATELLGALDRVQPLDMEAFLAAFPHDSATAYKHALQQMESTLADSKESERVILRNP